jgi:tetratricopeptide (TPR) repeat protein
VNRLVLIVGLLLTCARAAEIPGLPGVSVILDEQGSREVLQDALPHMQDWIANKGTKRQAPLPMSSREVTVDAQIVCGGRTYLSTPIPVSLAVPGPAGQSAEGKFHIMLNHPSAPTPPGMHAMTMSGIVGCTMVAFLPGFRSDANTIPEPQNRGGAMVFAINSLILHRAEGFSGVLLSPTFWSAPKEARDLFKQATESSLQRAVALDAHFAEAWYQLASLQEVTDPNAAGASYRKAIAADPAYIFPYQSLLRLETRQAAWEQVLETATQLLKLCPHSEAEAWYDLAFAADQLRRDPQAEQSARKGIEEDPDHTVPELERLLGKILSRKGDAADAAEHFRNYLQGASDAPDIVFIERQLGPASGVAAPGQSVADLVAALRSALQSRTPDEQIAKSLRDSKLAERLDDRTDETLESEGTGPLATAELRHLRDQSLRRPLPATPAIASPAPPSLAEQERIWDSAGQDASRSIESLQDFVCTREVRRYLEPDERPFDTQRSKIAGFNPAEFGELTEIFSTSYQAEYQWDHWTTLRQRPTHVYFFRIPIASSADTIEFQPPEGDHVYSAKASQQGFVYIDAATSRVVRLSWQTENVPLNFPMQSGATQLDFAFLDLGGSPRWLPMAADIRVESPAERHRILTEYRDYGKQ